MALDLSGMTQDQQIAAAAAYAGVPESVVRGQWRVESGMGTAKADPDGVIRSSAGAEGHFQVIPATRATFEERNGRKYDMRSFEDGLALYADVMRENMQLAKGDLTTALRIYQGGPNRRAWGKYNAAYASAVLQGTDVSNVPQTGASTPPIQPPSMLAAWNGGGGGFPNFNHKGADIPAAWRGDPINSGTGDLAKATKEHIGKVREALGELTMAASVTEGLTAEKGVAAAQAVRASDEVAPEFARQDVTTADAETNERNVAATYAAGAADREEAEFREGLTFSDKWGAAFDAGIGAAVASQFAREFEPVSEGWTYEPEKWELSHYTPDELEDIRDAAWSPNELTYTRDRIDTRRHSMRVKQNQSGWAGFGYDLFAGFTDPGNWVTGFGASAAARGAGVGSAALFQQGRVGAGIASTAAENAGAAVLTNTALTALGENRTVGQWLTDAAFSATIGVGFNLGQARAGAAARDKAVLDLTTENAQAFGAEWNAELRAKAEAELGDASPVLVNERVHQLAREEVLDWMRAGMADVPDDFRLFARPDVPEGAAEPTTVADAGPRASDRENITDGKFTDDVDGELDQGTDPLLARAPNARAREARGQLASSIFKNNRQRRAFAARTGLDTKISDPATRIQVAEVLARAERFSSQYGIDANKLQTVMQKVGLEATSTTLMSSQSPVARMIAITLLENPEGAAGRHSTAALDRKGRFESYMGIRPRQWEAAYRLWRSEVRKAGPIKDFASGWKMRQDFEYEVKLYREQTYMGREPSSGVHPSIVQMAKSLDEGYNRMAAEQRMVGTVGSSRLPTEDVAGYETRIWLGGKIAAAGAVRRESIRKALREQFNGIGAMYGDDFLEKFSIKYLERIEERAAGMHRRPDNLFSDDESDTLRDTLRALDMNEEDIAKVMGRYSRGGAKHTKSRIDLDVTKKYRDAEGEFRLVDYLDNRVIDNYRRYAGRVAGDVALAKFGVLGDAGIAVLKKAMQVTGATDAELRAFDQVMSEFTGRAVGTGDPTLLANARLLTTAVQLGGAGINQAAEYSNGLPAVGAAGVAQAIGIAPRMRKEILKILKGEDSGNNILSGFEFISGRGAGLAGYDLHMFNGLDTQASLYGSERAGFITALSQRAANSNRILSGQRAVLAVQQRGFAEVLIAKGVKFLQDGLEADTALKDMGINDALLARLRSTQDQVVRWGSDGKLEAVDPRVLTELKDRQAWLAFYQAIERGTAQILQDTFIGETGKWAHNGWLKLLFQHRTFSLVAQQKQLGRYLGLYGAWGTAGIIVGAMAVAAPLQALRVASRVALMNDADREEAIDQNIMSPLALGKATLNYVSAVGMLNDVVDVGTGVAGGWYEHATDTGAPDWVRELAGGQLGNRKEIVGGQLAPALGVVNSAAQAIQGRPENLGELLPGGRLPYIIPLLKGAESQME